MLCFYYIRFLGGVSYIYTWNLTQLLPINRETEKLGCLLIEYSRWELTKRNLTTEKQTMSWGVRICAESGQPDRQSGSCLMELWLELISTLPSKAEYRIRLGALRKPQYHILTSPNAPLCSIASGQLDSLAWKYLLGRKQN